MYNLFKNFFGKVLKTLKMSKGGQIYMEDPVGSVPLQESPTSFIPVSHSQTLLIHFWPPYGQSELIVQPENYGKFSKHVKVGLKIQNEKGVIPEIECQHIICILSSGHLF